MNTIRIKAKHNNTIRAFTLDTSNADQYTAVQNQIVTLFALSEAPTLSYQDDEKDTVLIGNDQEFALACGENKSLTVFVNGATNEKNSNSCGERENKRLKRIDNRVERIHSKIEKSDGEKKKKLEKRLNKLQEEQIVSSLEHMGIDKENNGVQVEEPKEKHICRDRAKCLNNRINKITIKMENASEEHKKKLEKRLAKLRQQLLGGEKPKKERKQKKLDKKQRKECDKKRKREERQIVPITDSFDLEQGWPSSITKVYLDGNNMLFVPTYLRNKTLNKGRNAAENALSHMAMELGTKENVATHVMYDSTSTTYESERFSITSARPTHESTDDALVEIAKQVSDAGIDQDSLDHYLFVTSDRELRSRLVEQGAKVIKPKQWFKYAFERINDDEEKKFEDVSQMLKDKFDSQ